MIQGSDVGGTNRVRHHREGVAFESMGDGHIFRRTDKRFGTYLTAAGVPSFSNKIPSSKLLELQDPQSPTPARTKLHFFASFWISSSVIGSDAVGFLDQMTSFTSNLALS